MKSYCCKTQPPEVFERKIFGGQSSDSLLIQTETHVCEGEYLVTNEGARVWALRCGAGSYDYITDAIRWAPLPTFDD